MNARPSARTSRSSTKRGIVSMILGLMSKKRSVMKARWSSVSFGEGCRRSDPVRVASAGGEVVELVEQHRREVEGDCEVGELGGQGDHVDVVLGGVEPHPGSGDDAVDLGVAGLVLVPDQGDLEVGQVGLWFRLGFGLGLLGLGRVVGHRGRDDLTVGVARGRRRRGGIDRRVRLVVSGARREHEQGRQAGCQPDSEGRTTRHRHGPTMTHRADRGQRARGPS